MKDILTILRKDVLDTLRDKRSLSVTVLMPLLVFPLIFFVVAQVSKSTTESELTKELTIGIASQGDDLGIRAMLSATPKMTLVDVADGEQLAPLVPDSFDLGISIPVDFASQVEGRQTGSLEVFYDRTEEIPIERLSGILDVFSAQQKAIRLDSLGLNQANIEPIKITKVNVASDKEMLGKLAGGFLPYLIISFSFLGCMFVSIDLFAGEKERGSFETILTVPVDRWKILVGKMLVIITMGMISTILAFLGLFIGLNLADSLPEQLMTVVNEVLTPGFFFYLMGLLLLLNIFFAGLMTPISLFARNFKEAQSTLSPMNILVLMPALVAVFPGVELTPITAAIPVMNIVLCTKEVIAGTIETHLLLITVASMVVLAGAFVFVSFRRFGNESNILRA